MILRRADCGHYIPEDVAPAGVHHGSEQPIYLCNECAERARGHRVQVVETKAIEPVQATTGGIQVTLSEAVTRQDVVPARRRPGPKPRPRY